MILPKFLHTAVFRFTFLYTCVFVTSVALLGVFIFFDVRFNLEQELRHRIESDMSQLIGDYHDDGLEELRHDIRERVDPEKTERLIYILQSPSKRIMFDSIPNVPSEQGWHYLRFKKSNNITQQVLVKTIYLKKGFIFAVGADLNRVRIAEDAILRSFSIACIFILIMSIFGGFWLSQRFLSQVNRIAETTERISQGELSARIPITGTRGDFDYLSNVINKMLERIEKLVNNVQHVSTAIAHDLRTPLGHLRQKLEHHIYLNHSQSDIFTDAVKNIDSILATFTAILRIAEIESKAQRAGFKDLDLSKTLNNALEIYRAVIEDSGKILSTNIQKDIWIKGDEQLLLQMLANLIENILQHSQASQIIVNLIRSNNCITLIISDNGIGISEEHIHKVQQPFYKGDASRTHKGKGLGLHLVAVISKIHGLKLNIFNVKPGLEIKLTYTKNINY
ncbi:MAG: HAMP domain-containing sensor histidine kinase [Pseudomonadota bacterium]